MFPSRGAGKGDADRSPGWRKHYDEIKWEQDHYITAHAFRKTYGVSAPKCCPADESDWRKPATPTFAEFLLREYERQNPPVETNPF